MIKHDYMIEDTQIILLCRKGAMICNELCRLQWTLQVPTRLSSESGATQLDGVAASQCGTRGKKHQSGQQRTRSFSPPAKPTFPASLFMGSQHRNAGLATCCVCPDTLPPLLHSMTCVTGGICSRLPKTTRSSQWGFPKHFSPKSYCFHLRPTRYSFSAEDWLGQGEKSRDGPCFSPSNVWCHSAWNETILQEEKRRFTIHKDDC